MPGGPNCLVERRMYWTYDITINNILGQTIYTTTTSAMKSIIDLSNFDKGIYTVELRNKNKLFAEKLIIQ